MNLKYKIAVLGPIPKDHITTYGGEVIEKYGGINHPTIALARLLDKNSMIIPVTHVRKCDEVPIKNILRTYSNINLQHIVSKEDKGDVIQLRFLDLNQRIEKQSGAMNAIVSDDMTNLLDCDAYVIVPVTDFEVPLDTLKFIKKQSNGLVLFDAHGPTTTLTKFGNRLPKFWSDLDDWLPYIDILKMNLDEAKYCWPELNTKKESSFLEKDLMVFGKHCLDQGIKALYITLDSGGCIVYHRANYLIHGTPVPGIKVKEAVDSTGCGDSFAAGVAFGVLKTGDYIQAARYGNALGAQRIQGKTFEVFKSLAETEQMIKEAYGQS